MAKKIVRNWKPMLNGLSLSEAIKMFKSRTIDGKQYDIVAIRLGYKILQTDAYNIDESMFSVKEITCNNWEIMIPDDGMEVLTNKLRKIVKEEHFSGLNFDKIDNMSIDELWQHIRDWKLNFLDKNGKYRLLKCIIENKLYKNS